MALLDQTSDYHFRQTNKEPEWSSLCNNVFDEYLGTDDMFGFVPSPHENSSSDGSGNLFDFSTGSEQSYQTSGTSPIPSWEHGVIQSIKVVEAQQPQAKEPVDFWTKTLWALERNAAESEQKERTIRAAKSHPDFLSLGGCPSPPAIPLSPTDQSYSAQRRRSRPAANGRKASQARSLSRGRPTGVTKAVSQASINSYATVRRCSASPAKAMMNPSRYRAGFKDVWAERMQHSPKKYELRVPTAQMLPESPPPSARGQLDDDFAAAFGSPSTTMPSYVPLPAYDDQLSPLTTNFQHAHIHTPIGSPSLRNAVAHANNATYFQDVPPLPTSSYVDDGTSLFIPEGTSGLAANSIQAFDFGFSSSPTDLANWTSSAPFSKPQYGTDHLSSGTYPFGGLDTAILPTTEPHGGLASGLGISCDPSLVSNKFSDTAILPAAVYQPIQPYYMPPSAAYPHTIPIASHAPSHPRSRSRHRGRRASSPSPTPPRSSRARSRHRRTKSTNTTTPQRSPDKPGGEFVNFTPSDSNKILSGVAPSGSSKTKARREKEAADKRRRLSQAAVRAVVEAGGDLESLAKAGLI